MSSLHHAAHVCSTLAPPCVMLAMMEGPSQSSQEAKGAAAIIMKCKHRSTHLLTDPAERSLLLLCTRQLDTCI